jgi:hypothetical protein
MQILLTTKGMQELQHTLPCSPAHLRLHLSTTWESAFTQL